MNRQQPLRRRQPMRPGAPLKRAPLPPGTRTALARIPVQSCCGKRRFATREAADLEVGRLSRTGRDKTPVFAYKCGQGWWHLTSQNPVDRIARGAAKARARDRETGFSAAVRLAIRTRAGNGNPDDARCEACAIWLGRHGGQCQHIAARGMGGTRRPEASRVDGGVLLCGTPQTGDHGLCEARDEHMRAMGFWRNSWEEPGPIMLHGKGGGGVTVWLTPEGGYSTSAPAVAS